MTTTVHRPTREAEIRSAIDTLTHELLASVKSYRQAKATFAERTAIHVAALGDTVEADWEAAADWQRNNAITDAQWFRDDASVAAAAITALTAVLQVARPEAVRRA